MARKSARFFEYDLGMSAKQIYIAWQKMGLVVKDKFGDWALTEAGRNIGGRMSKSNYCPVPTFDSDIIMELMK